MVSFCLRILIWTGLLLVPMSIAWTPRSPAAENPAAENPAAENPAAENPAAENPAKAISGSTGLAAGISDELNRPIRVERDLVFRRIDGESLAADLYRPNDRVRYPLVLMIHGGAWSAGDKWQVGDHARELAQAGFVALSINYRLAPRHPLPDQIADCRAALVWADQQAEKWQADSSRLCLWGYSAGAHLSAWMATDRQPGEPAIRAVVAGGAPCDFEFIPPESRALVYVMGGTRQQLPDVYAQAAPLTHASAQSPPFFFFHGETDLLVPASSSRKLYDKLRSFAVESEYCLVKQRGHLLTFIDFDARRRAIEFLRHHTAKVEH